MCVDGVVVVLLVMDVAYERMNEIVLNKWSRRLYDNMYCAKYINSIQGHKDGTIEKI